jgi:hypothetical protein
MKPAVVRALVAVCEHTHWATHRRPLIWLLPVCPFARLSLRLEDRWGTDEWKTL